MTYTKLAGLLPLIIGFVLILILGLCRRRFIILAGNNPRPAGLPVSSQSGPHRPNIPLEYPKAFSQQTLHPSGGRLRDNTNGRSAIERTLRVLRSPEAQAALSTIWQKNDMLLQLHRLERLHSALQESAVVSVPSGFPPARPAPFGSRGSVPHNFPETTPYPDSTTAFPPDQAVS